MLNGRTHLLNDATEQVRAKHGVQSADTVQALQLVRCLERVGIRESVLSARQQHSVAPTMSTPVLRKVSSDTICSH
jgi:hypothetical protein